MKISAILSLFFFTCLYAIGQNASIKGAFNDEYIIWDTCNLYYGKELFRGPKNDSCLVLRYFRTAAGSDWLKVKTADTIGFVNMDFISFDKSKLSILIKLNHDQYTNSADEEWLLNNKKETTLRNEKAKIEKAKMIEKINNEFKAFLSKSIIFITSHSFPESEYLKYPGFNVSIYNAHPKKVIKYTWFTITAYNPVNDIVGTNTVRAIGPILPSKFGDYNFEFVFRSNIIETCKIVKIKIQYMDGSVVTIDKPSIDNILSKTEKFWSFIERVNDL